RLPAQDAAEAAGHLFAAGPNNDQRGRNGKCREKKKTARPEEAQPRFQKVQKTVGIEKRFAPVEDALARTRTFARTLRLDTRGLRLAGYQSRLLLFGSKADGRFEQPLVLGHLDEFIQFFLIQRLAKTFLEARADGGSILRPVELEQQEMLFRPDLEERA